MFGYKSVKDYSLQERLKNEELQAALNKANADLEYLAMMTDVELEQEEQEDIDYGDEQV